MGIFALQNIVQLTFSGRKILTPYGKENIYPVLSEGGSRKAEVESRKSKVESRKILFGFRRVNVREV